MDESHATIYVCFDEHAVDLNITTHDAHHNATEWNEDAFAFYDKIGANVLKEWITLRMETSDMKALIGESR